ncbi:Non-specific lipid transfer protein GPI-anchored 7 [Linum grandiflorum]
MASSTSSTTTAALIVLLAITAITLTDAQGNVGNSGPPSCASKLIPCAPYITNTTKPPATCCDSIKETVRTELPCLCNLYNTPGLLSSFGINVTQAIDLTTRCGVSADVTACPKPGAPSPGASAVPTPPSRGQVGRGIKPK